MKDTPTRYSITLINALGDHDLPPQVHKAMVYASAERFCKLDDDECTVLGYSIEQSHRDLARHIIFHGPFEDMDEAMESAKMYRALIVVPDNDRKNRAWVASLSN